MKVDKNLARKQIEVYGDLLRGRAVIGDITPVEKRGEQRHVVEVLDDKYPYEFECGDVKELATVLTAMWTAYQKAWNLLIA